MSYSIKKYTGRIFLAMVFTVALALIVGVSAKAGMYSTSTTKSGNYQTITITFEGTASTPTKIKERTTNQSGYGATVKAKTIYKDNLGVKHTFGSPVTQNSVPDGSSVTTAYKTITQTSGRNYGGEGYVLFYDKNGVQRTETVTKYLSEIRN